TMKDILGQAIADHFHRRSSAKLRVYTKWGHDAEGNPTGSAKEIMPIKTYFRDEDEMPELEWIALQQCKGRVLDIGAGAGSHSLFLQKLGTDVTALDISPLNTKTMKERGVKKVLRHDFFTLRPAGSYDTLLLLMNGIGIASTLDGLHLFLQKARTLLRPGGALVFDSSNVAYLYQGRPPKKGPYYGEIWYRYEYRRQRTEWFSWLFVDKRTLRRIATEEGWKMRVLFEDKFDQYLVKLTPTG
ncbi:MAG TPA: class I SAM-dependent methyltransferase, partial [Puia sp.]|nr:class I SAM-dependent methyltransferase [Puia sp.]